MTLYGYPKSTFQDYGIGFRMEGGGSTQIVVQAYSVKGAYAAAYRIMKGSEGGRVISCKARSDMTRDERVQWGFEEYIQPANIDWRSLDLY